MLPEGRRGQAVLQPPPPSRVFQRKAEPAFEPYGLALELGGGSGAATDPDAFNPLAMTSASAGLRAIDQRKRHAMQVQQDAASAADAAGQQQPGGLPRRWTAQSEENLPSVHPLAYISPPASHGGAPEGDYGLVAELKHKRPQAGPTDDRMTTDFGLAAEVARR